jgi:hypothetical protein
MKSANKQHELTNRQDNSDAVIMATSDSGLFNSEDVLHMPEYINTLVKSNGTGSSDITHVPHVDFDSDIARVPIGSDYSHADMCSDETHTDVSQPHADFDSDIARVPIGSDFSHADFDSDIARKPIGSDFSHADMSSDETHTDVSQPHADFDSDIARVPIGSDFSHADFDSDIARKPIGSDFSHADDMSSNETHTDVSQPHADFDSDIARVPIGSDFSHADFDSDIARKPIGSDFSHADDMSSNETHTDVSQPHADFDSDIARVPIGSDLTNEKFDNDAQVAHGDMNSNAAHVEFDSDIARVPIGRNLSDNDSNVDTDSMVAHVDMESEVAHADFDNDIARLPIGSNILHEDIDSNARVKNLDVDNNEAQHVDKNANVSRVSSDSEATLVHTDSDNTHVHLDSDSTLVRTDSERAGTAVMPADDTDIISEQVAEDNRLELEAPTNENNFSQVVMENFIEVNTDTNEEVVTAKSDEEIKNDTNEDVRQVVNEESASKKEVNEETKGEVLDNKEKIAEKVITKEVNDEVNAEISNQEVTNGMVNGEYKDMIDNEESNEKTNAGLTNRQQNGGEYKSKTDVHRAETFTDLKPIEDHVTNQVADIVENSAVKLEMLLSGQEEFSDKQAQQENNGDMDGGISQPFNNYADGWIFFYNAITDRPTDDSEHDPKNEYSATSADIADTSEVSRISNQENGNTLSSDAQKDMADVAVNTRLASTDGDTGETSVQQSDSNDVEHLKTNMSIPADIRQATFTVDRSQVANAIATDLTSNQIQLPEPESGYMSGEKIATADVHSPNHSFPVAPKNDSASVLAEATLDRDLNTAIQETTAAEVVAEDKENADEWGEPAATVTDAAVAALAPEMAPATPADSGIMLDHEQQSAADGEDVASPEEKIAAAEESGDATLLIAAMELLLARSDAADGSSEISGQLTPYAVTRETSNADHVTRQDETDNENDVPPSDVGHDPFPHAESLIASLATTLRDNLDADTIVYNYNDQAKRPLDAQAHFGAIDGGDNSVSTLKNSSGENFETSYKNNNDDENVDSMLPESAGKVDIPQQSAKLTRSTSSARNVEARVTEDVKLLCSTIISLPQQRASNTTEQ